MQPTPPKTMAPTGENGRHASCKEVIQANCDIEHLQNDQAQLKGDMRRLFDKLDSYMKWMIGLFVGIGLESVAIIIMIVLTLTEKQ